MNSINKNILLISFAFPPMAGSGIHRVVKFAKYLPKFGYNPVILTVNKFFCASQSRQYADEIKNLKIYRTNSFDFIKIKNKVIKTQAAGADCPAAPTPNKKQKSLLKHFLDFINQYILIPDDKLGWIPFAASEGLKIIKKEKIDLIYATGDPFSAFLVGCLLKKLTRKKLIVDYRDSWTDFNQTDSIYHKGWYRKRLENFMEYAVLKTADKIISVSPLINEKLRKKHEKIDAKKYAVIHNGYDSEDFKDIKKIKNEKFIITHAGTFGSYRSPLAFLRALAELLNENPGLKNSVEARLVGSSLEENINDILDKYNLRQNVKITGYLSHDECVKEIVNADALLLIQDYKFAEAYSGKVFEYLYSKNPILAIVNPLGCAADLIRKTNSGIVVKDESIQSIKEAIKEIYHKKSFNPNREMIKEFDRARLTEKLAKTFDGLLSCGLKSHLKI